MTETAKKTDEAPAKTAKPVLARASESGDPAVHALLAELQTARANSNTDEAAAIVRRLAELGYE